MMDVSTKVVNEPGTLIKGRTRRRGRGRNKKDEEDSTLSAQERFFSNSLLWKHLSRFLNHGDFKALRLVNHQFNSFVLCDTNYTARTRAYLFDGDVNAFSKAEFGSSSHLWRHFQFVYIPAKDHPDSDFSWALPLMKNAQSIELFVRGHKSRTKADSPPLDKILQAPTHLKELALTANVLQAPATPMYLQRVSSSPRGKKNLDSLEAFSIRDALWYLNGDNFITSIGILKGHLKNLKVLRIGNVFHGYALCDFEELEEYLNDPRNASIYVKFVGMIEIVLQNREQLVELQVNDLLLWSIPPGIPGAASRSIVTHHFPQLQRLSIRGHECQEEHLVNFLKRHLSRLEELDLVMFHTVSNDLFRVIQENGGNLKKLRIKTKTFWQSEVGSWNFLKNSRIQFLQDFTLEFIPTKMYYRIVDSPSLILSCLPKSIKKISFTWLVPDVPEDGDADDGDDENPNANPDENVNVNDDSKKISKPLKPLTSADFENINKNQLTHLTLMNMPGAVDDSTMEFIIGNFTNLQHLNVWNSCPEVTDYGMTGVKKKAKLTTSTFSLKDLKSLEYLAFNSQKVTNKTFLHAIQFRELKHLKIQFQFSLFKNEHLTSSVVPEMLRNNGSLLCLETPGVYNHLVYYPNKKERLKWNPRLLTYMIDSDHQQTDGDMSAHDSSDSENEIID